MNLIRRPELTFGEHDGLDIVKECLEAYAASPSLPRGFDAGAALGSWLTRVRRRAVGEAVGRSIDSEAAGG
jgi:hypothetical protein